MKTPFHKLPAFRGVHFILLLPKQERNCSLGPPLLFCTVFLSYFSVPPFFFFPALLGLWDLSSLTRDWTGPWQWECRVLTSGQPGNSLLRLFSCQRLPTDPALCYHLKQKPELSPRIPVSTLCPRPFSPAMSRDKNQSHKARLWVEGDHNLWRSLSGATPPSPGPSSTQLWTGVVQLSEGRPRVFSGPSFPLGGLEFPFSLILLLNLLGNSSLFLAHLQPPSLFPAPSLLCLVSIYWAPPGCRQSARHQSSSGDQVLASQSFHLRKGETLNLWQQCDTPWGKRKMLRGGRDILRGRFFEKRGGNIPSSEKALGRRNWVKLGWLQCSEPWGEWSHVRKGRQADPPLCQRSEVSCLLTCTSDKLGPAEKEGCLWNFSSLSPPF